MLPLVFIVTHQLSVRGEMLVGRAIGDDVPDVNVAHAARSAHYRAVWEVLPMLRLVEFRSRHTQVRQVDASLTCCS